MKNFFLQKRLLYEIEKNHGEPLSKMSLKEFQEKNPEERLQLITNPPKKFQDLKENSELRFDFQGNKEIEMKISLQDILPANIRTIEINSQKGKRYDCAGQFWTNQDKTERLKIFTGTKVKILETNSNYVKEKKARLSESIEAGKEKSRIVQIARKYLGTVRIEGGGHGNNSKGLDCSGLVNRVLSEFYKRKINLNTSGYRRNSIPTSNPQPGDLFFTNGGKHMGIVATVNNGKVTSVIHSSSSKKRIVEVPPWGNFEYRTFILS